MDKFNRQTCLQDFYKNGMKNRQFSLFWPKKNYFNGKQDIVGLCSYPGAVIFNIM